MSRRNLTYTQLMTLRALAADGGVSASDLADALDITPSAARGRLRTLERWGMVERQKRTISAQSYSPATQADAWFATPQGERALTDAGEHPDADAQAAADAETRRTLCRQVGIPADSLEDAAQGEGDAERMSIFLRADDGTCAVGAHILTCARSQYAAELAAAIDHHGFGKVGALPEAEYQRRRAAQAEPTPAPSSGGVVRSAEYGQAERDLQRDPIIRELARELAALSPEARPDLTGWGFVRGALAEYERRGGAAPHHIGAPAAAVRALLEGGADLSEPEPTPPEGDGPELGAAAQAYAETPEGERAERETPSRAYRDGQHVGVGAWLRHLHDARGAAERAGSPDPFDGTPTFVQGEREGEMCEVYQGGGRVWHLGGADPSERRTRISWPLPPSSDALAEREREAREYRAELERGAELARELERDLGSAGARDLADALERGRRYMLGEAYDGGAIGVERWQMAAARLARAELERLRDGIGQERGRAWRRATVIGVARYMLQGDAATGDADDEPARLAAELERARVGAERPAGVA